MKRIAIAVLASILVCAGVLSVGLATGSSPAEEQKTYGPGWLNMAHVGSTQPIAQALSAIESNVGVVYYLSPDTGAWLRYVPGKPEVSNLTTMDFGQSYLLLLTAPTAMTIPTEATFLATPTACSASDTCTTNYILCSQSLTQCKADVTQCTADVVSCRATAVECFAAYDESVAWEEAWACRANCLSKWGNGEAGLACVDGCGPWPE